MRPPLVGLSALGRVFFCDHCIKREFQHQREIACPACEKPVKKSQLQDKTIEELNFVKETSVRKKVTKDLRSGVRRRRREGSGAEAVEAVSPGERHRHRHERRQEGRRRAANRAADRGAAEAGGGAAAAAAA
ncbi:hypothetical protein ON010_g18992 [Phytophthora cinnamomi]|nr:hypothetical protein ON010_g18992 [Phytophthora cinnamomi]